MSNSNQLSFKRLFSSPVAWLSFAVFLCLGYGVRYIYQPEPKCPPIKVVFNTLTWDTAKNYVYNLRPQIHPIPPTPPTPSTPPSPELPNWGTYLDLSKGNLDTIGAYFNQNSAISNVRVYLGLKKDSAYFFISPLNVTGNDTKNKKISYYTRKETKNLPCPRYCDISNTAMGVGGLPSLAY